ncbi:hypothetical protein [Streptomyces fumanus]|uniref:Uncharacterized protein n=1 Tax=Streptomyces fumanus TaxID=67302 RepID=A0A919A3A1_9ACTN|nr:hypothetical protein [Streptomyces fumanus]GHE84949.1 hypothetical protein GCM10018772_05110 [Streptomyces fumanus]
MTHGTQPPQPQDTPRTTAIRNAAAAANAHQTNPTPHTLRLMQHAVQTAQNHGATLHDIRNARTTAATA